VRTAVRSGQFRRDAKRARKRGKDMSKLRELILLLLAGEALPQRYQARSRAIGPGAHVRLLAHPGCFR
jgi:mRNA-degrading endonuclease YafQ of YafQ-DinJ toxin-antitoxin module